MANNIVITIARQYGSGGREIGKLVADKLGITYLDKEILTKAVTDSGIAAGFMQHNDEKVGGSFGQAIAAGGMQSYFNSEISVGDKVFLAESDAIKAFAKAGSCVIIGRCASYILRDEVPHLSVFVNANLEDRIHRAIHEYGEPEKKIKERLAKRDKQRAHYHNYYTDEKWMDLEQYDITVNSSSLGLEQSADLIIQAAKLRCCQP